MASSSKTSESNLSVDTLPDVIKFCYVDFKSVKKGVNNNKLISIAKCKRCGATICDKPGTTSGFVRHLSVAAHASLRKE